MEIGNKQNLIRDLYYLSLALVIVTMPFSIRINNLAIIISISSWFVLISSKSNIKTMFQAFKANNVAMLLVLFALANLGSVLIHISSYDDWQTPLKTIEKRIHFLMFPLVLSGLVFLSRNKIRQLLKVFVFTIIFTTLFSLIIGLIVSIKTGTIDFVHSTDGTTGNNFMYHRLGSYIGIHAVFFSSYTLFAYCIVLIKLLWGYRVLNAKRRRVYVLVLIYFSVIIFLLYSIAITTVLFICTILILGYFGFKPNSKVNWQYRLSFVSLFIIGIIAGVVITKKLNVKDRLIEYNFEDTYVSGPNNWNVLNLRLAKWKIASEAIQDNWLLGVGPGNMTKTLDVYYENHNFYFALRRHFNPHNQFLHTFLQLGIVGLFILLWGLYSAIRLSIVRKDLVLGSLLIMFLIFSLTASTLSVSKGIVFFSFFLSFLSYLKKGTMPILVEEKESQS